MTAAQTSVLYASVGRELAWYAVDADEGTLARRGAVTLPANVQYVWPHASGDYLYVTSSDSASGIGGFVGKTHHASAFRIERASGALSPHGEPIALPHRPVHHSTDMPSAHLLVAYNNPSGVTVHRIARDGTLDGDVRQPEPVDPGIFAHQIRVTPDNRLAIVVARGNDPQPGRPEDPGALKVYRFEEGRLTRGTSIAPGGGYGFGARHLDFHPAQPWIYVSVERQNQLAMFVREGDAIEPAPRFVTSLLEEPQNVRPRQLGGTVHVHPKGHVVYAANRSSDHTVDFRGTPVFAGGENSIAVYSIDARTGEPRLIQHAPTHAFHPRTFSIDPSGRLLVAAHITAVKVREGDAVKTVPAALSVFRIADDGTLTFLRKVDVAVGDAKMWWAGIVPL